MLVCDFNEQDMINNNKGTLNKVLEILFLLILGSILEVSFEFLSIFSETYILDVYSCYEYTLIYLFDQYAQLSL